jgi:phage shock protein A
MTKNPFDRLANLGEEVLGKASQNPSLGRVVQGAMQLKDRVDELSKRVRGLEAMEKRLGALETRVAELEGARKRAPAAEKKPSAPKKSSSSGS